jgi:hypothetical protein
MQMQHVPSTAAHSRHSSHSLTRGACQPAGVRRLRCAASGPQHDEPPATSLDNIDALLGVAEGELASARLWNTQLLQGVPQPDIDIRLDASAANQPPFTRSIPLHPLPSLRRAAGPRQAAGALVAAQTQAVGTTPPDLDAPSRRGRSLRGRPGHLRHQAAQRQEHAAGGRAGHPTGALGVVQLWLGVLACASSQWVCWAAGVRRRQQQQWVQVVHSSSLVDQFKS